MTPVNVTTLFKDNIKPMLNKGSSTSSPVPNEVIVNTIGTLGPQLQKFAKEADQTFDSDKIKRYLNNLIEIIKNGENATSPASEMFDDGTTNMQDNLFLLKIAIEDANLSDEHLKNELITLVKKSLDTVKTDSSILFNDISYSQKVIDMIENNPHVKLEHYADREKLGIYREAVYKCNSTNSNPSRDGRRIVIGDKTMANRDVTHDGHCNYYATTGKTNTNYRKTIFTPDAIYDQLVKIKNKNNATAAAHLIVGIINSYDGFPIDSNIKASWLGGSATIDENALRDIADKLSQHIITGHPSCNLDFTLATALMKPENKHVVCVTIKEGYSANILKDAATDPQQILESFPKNTDFLINVKEKKLLYIGINSTTLKNEVKTISLNDLGFRFKKDKDPTIKEVETFLNTKDITKKLINEYKLYPPVDEARGRTYNVLDKDGNMVTKDTPQELETYVNNLAPDDVVFIMQDGSEHFQMLKPFVPGKANRHDSTSRQYFPRTNSKPAASPTTSVIIEPAAQKGEYNLKLGSKQYTTVTLEHATGNNMDSLLMVAKRPGANDLDKADIFSVHNVMDKLYTIAQMNSTEPSPVITAITNEFPGCQLPPEYKYHKKANDEFDKLSDNPDFLKDVNNEGIYCVTDNDQFRFVKVKDGHKAEITPRQNVEINIQGETIPWADFEKYFGFYGDPTQADLEPIAENVSNHITHDNFSFESTNIDPKNAIVSSILAKRTDQLTAFVIHNQNKEINLAAYNNISGELVTLPANQNMGTWLTTTRVSVNFIYYDGVNKRFKQLQEVSVAPTATPSTNATTATSSAVAGSTPQSTATASPINNGQSTPATNHQAAPSQGINSTSIPSNSTNTNTTIPPVVNPNNSNPQPTTPASNSSITPSGTNSASNSTPNSTPPTNNGVIQKSRTTTIKEKFTTKLNSMRSNHIVTGTGKEDTTIAAPTSTQQPVTTSNNNLNNTTAPAEADLLGLHQSNGPSKFENLKQQAKNKFISLFPNAPKATGTSVPAQQLQNPPIIDLLSFEEIKTPQSLPSSNNSMTSEQEDPDNHTNQPENNNEEIPAETLEFLGAFNIGNNSSSNELNENSNDKEDNLHEQLDSPKQDNHATPSPAAPTLEERIKRRDEADDRLKKSERETADGIASLNTLMGFTSSNLPKTKNTKTVSGTSSNAPSSKAKNPSFFGNLSLPRFTNPFTRTKENWHASSQLHKNEQKAQEIFGRSSSTHSNTTTTTSPTRSSTNNGSVTTRARSASLSNDNRITRQRTNSESSIHGADAINNGNESLLSKGRTVDPKTNLENTHLKFNQAHAAKDHQKKEAKPNNNNLLEPQDLTDDQREHLRAMKRTEHIIIDDQSNNSEKKNKSESTVKKGLWLFRKVAKKVGSNTPTTTTTTTTSTQYENNGTAALDTNSDVTDPLSTTSDKTSPDHPNENVEIGNNSSIEAVI